MKVYVNGQERTPFLARSESCPYLSDWKENMINSQKMTGRLLGKVQRIDGKEKVVLSRRYLVDDDRSKKGEQLVLESPFLQMLSFLDMNKDKLVEGLFIRI